MPEESDFERAWLAKMARCLDAVAGEAVRREVMHGSDGLSDASRCDDIIRWSQGAMQRLEALLDEPKRRQVMTGCACQYPKEGLLELRQSYEATGHLAVAHRGLQARFESFLRGTLGLSDDEVSDIIMRGWGLAGVLDGHTVIATKIPKSGNLRDYLHETDPQRRRQLYCHCPRVRAALKRRQALPVTYCYCGAGFYQGMWEEILGRRVDVEVLESVLAGGEVCRVAVHLPARRVLAGML